MATTPLTIDMFDDKQRRPKDWAPKKLECAGPLRLARLCILGMFLPAILVAGPVYLRYRVYSEQLYPLAATDQRLIDGKISTTWCQRQVVKVNTTFNAYLINGDPQIKIEPTPVSMTRHLVLEDDMKEYWGFYLLRGSSVTVSTCVRWPGASLTIIRGHKHLHECAFIGDDSSEELEELLEIAEEQGLFNGTGHPLNQKKDGPSNEPAKMKRAHQDVQFHHKGNAPASNNTLPPLMSNHHYTSHELGAKEMREILTNLFARKLVAKNKQKENPHHHYEGVYKETANIKKPPLVQPDKFLWQLETVEKLFGRRTTTTAAPTKKTQIEKSRLEISTPSPKPSGKFTKKIGKDSETSTETSSEVVADMLKRIDALGDRGKNVLEKLSENLKEREKNGRKINSGDGENLGRKKRQVVLSSPALADELNRHDEEEDMAVEKEDLHPDGIAEDRGTVNESTLNDRSNSEFWSSFSSSEERLMECKGLILNLPLTPHHRCTPQYEDEHVKASIANTVTYRVPVNGYYFFVFNSENELQPNYVRVKFDLVKTYYNTSNPVVACQNSTQECSLPFNFFSWERTVLELPFNGNDSQWNEEYVVVSHCEPRTAIYLVCMITVPLLILLFAFQ
ncbi:uncharacterized protein LOC135165530 isoform X1 [Diachasmimorpha longicaudata]|uniref:uncharacterized protein LOC135165530 isoform X1 n=2 Tax=Diachasmimorpha longicaudata TaxID=58733 RepID=UPI0030B918A1